MKQAFTALIALLAAAPAAAHIAWWAPGMYGAEPGNRDADAASRPLGHKTFDEWWFHGFLDQPPPTGEFLELPAGGKAKGSASCSKHYTSLISDPYPNPRGMACPSGRNAEGTNTGMEHSTDAYDTPIDQLKDVRGCGLAIAYESDPTKIKPEDFAVISTVYDCPWKIDVQFDIPADLPPCPPGGCHCLWGWQHGPGGGGEEITLTFYKCQVTGATGTRALPKPVLARKCPFDKNNCTTGAKQMFFWQQQERNNWLSDVWDPPFYNGDYGFTDGAQTDLWYGEDLDMTALSKGWSTAMAPSPKETFDYTPEQLKITPNAYLATATANIKPNPAATANANGSLAANPQANSSAAAQPAGQPAVDSAPANGQTNQMLAASPKPAVSGAAGAPSSPVSAADPNASPAVSQSAQVPPAQGSAPATGEAPPNPAVPAPPTTPSTNPMPADPSIPPTQTPGTPQAPEQQAPPAPAQGQAGAQTPAQPPSTPQAGGPVDPVQAQREANQATVDKQRAENQATVDQRAKQAGGARKRETRRSRQ